MRFTFRDLKKSTAVPPSKLDVQVVHAGRDGWQESTAEFMNSVAALLLSALPETSSIAALLKSGVEIWHGNECKVPVREDAPAWCDENAIYLAESALGYPILCAIALGHELSHVVNDHFAPNLPPNIPERGVERNKIRAEWETIALPAELEINSTLVGYVQGLENNKGDGEKWIRELGYYRANAETRLAYNRARIAICEVSEMLRQLAHHDSSVQIPPQSKLFVHCQRLNDTMISRHPELLEMQIEQSTTQVQFSEYRVPQAYAQVATVEESLEIWRKEITKAIQSDRELAQIILEINRNA